MNDSSSFLSFLRPPFCQRRERHILLLPSQSAAGCGMKDKRMEADYVKHEKIEEEILRQRMEQVSRLRSKLIRERMLREQADVLSDEDIDKVIGYISAGFSLQGPGGLRIGPGGGRAGLQLSEHVPYVARDDNYIFEEIKAYYDTNRSLTGLHDTIPNQYKHNHRYKDKLKQIGAVNPKSRHFNFEYNRRLNTK
ncbi:hypothetical protein Ddc_15513 [Ditylenchus destructor]|nr:hypothetical protein Ddc_15513 [Ditylenchus destructor]